MTPRQFKLFVDSGSDDEPEPRRFGSLVAADQAFANLDEEWRPYAWIIELRHGDENVIHMRDGKRT